MASTEMVLIDPSWIFSPPVTPRTSPNPSPLDAKLNSPAESAGHLPPAKAPTIEELNQLTSKLMEVQISSAEESKGDKSVVHEVRHKESHGFVEITSVSNLPVLRRNGGVRILLDFSDAVDVSAYFRPFDEMPSDEANKNPSSTMDGEAHGPGDDATVWELPVFLRNGWDPMGHDSNHADLTPCLRSGSSFDVALPKRTSRL